MLLNAIALLLTRASYTRLQALQPQRRLTAITLIGKSMPAVDDAAEPMVIDHAYRTGT
jgi:hypothetical protein